MALNFLYVYVGIRAGDNLDRIFSFLEKFNYVFVAILIVLVIWYIYHHKSRKHLTHE